MKRQAIAAAVAVALGGGALNAQANTAGLSGIWTGTYSFTMFDPAGGAVGSPTAPQAWTWNFDAGTVEIANTTTFFAAGVWTAHDVVVTDTGTSYGPPPTVNMLFDWSVNVNIPVTSDWDVTSSGNVAGSTAVVGVNAATITAGSSVFPGFQPTFTGNLTKVPVPAAVWLFGSGLVGLVGVARRRRKS